jgi:cell division protease FtsH
MGGHAAEKLVFGEATTGASDDIRKATELAREMVTRYGMSRELGPVSFGQDSGSPLLGRGFETRQYAEATALEIDREVRELVSTAHARALELLRESRDVLDRASRVLLSRKTLQGDELDLALGPAGQKRPALPGLLQPLDVPE